MLGAIAAGSAGLAVPRSFAEAICGEQPALLPQALAALDAHAASIRDRDVVGIVNFAARSGLPRFQLVNVSGGRVFKTLLVAHGRGSDPLNSGWAERFSNIPGSNASSTGAFLTGGTYCGRHGRSRKLRGLDPGNSLAEPRAIVIHGADYVDQARALELGRIGRSQGCFAVSQAEIGGLLAILGPGRMLFAAK